MSTAPSERLTRRETLGLAIAALLPVSAGPPSDIWPQGFGPDGNGRTKRKAPILWSVARNDNVAWTVPLPEAGQGGLAVWENLIFLTTMKPLESADAPKEGADIVGHCLDAFSGKILWSVPLPGTEPSTYAYGFSDSTTPSPVTDGVHVWFFNASGSVGCYRLDGKKVWLRTWKPTGGRPFNKQFKPFLLGETLITMEPRDENDPKREKDPWNYLRGLDKHTGKTLWISEDALTHYNTPIPGKRKDGSWAILHGRGGYHDVPESPVGMTLTSLAPGREGRAIRRFEATGKALYNMHWDSKYAYWFDLDNARHQVFDIETGNLLRTQSLSEKVDYRRYDPEAETYVLESGIDLSKRSPAYRVFPAWYTNLPVGGWHYFLCFTDAETKVGPPYCVGRVGIETGKVEYLELPVQVIRNPGEPDRPVWNTPQTTETKNRRGFDVAGDPRSRRDGWHWNFLPAPIAADNKVYFTTMLGVTYVINGNAKTLDAGSLLSVNDLGPAGRTWSLTPFALANNRLYTRTLQEAIALGP
ncbi:MAG: hypothetical protein SFU56_00275 [Capsulimonadales bacterium]|nr:hypothetical protein [Capsulimonadales bacterium]